MEPSENANRWYRDVDSLAGQTAGTTKSRNVIWFPHAGGGAAPLFRCKNEVPDDFRLIVASLPGRETRFRDPLVESLDELISLLDDHLPSLSAPPILIGHSFGALVAYLLAKRQTQLGRPPQGLVVMTMASPDQVRRRETITNLADDEFIEQLDRRYGGVPKVLRSHPEAMKVFLPTVRQDLKLLESHRYEPSDPLPIPIRALAGSTDKMASRTAMQGWRLLTSKDFSLRVIPGDHFFPLQNVGSVLETAGRMWT